MERYQYLHNGVELGHGDLFGPLHGHGHLLLVLKLSSNLKEEKNTDRYLGRYGTCGLTKDKNENMNFSMEVPTLLEQRRVL